MTAGGFHRGEGPAPRPTDWNLPNALTVLRFLLVPVYGVLLFMEGGTSPWWRFWAWVVFVARRRHRRHRRQDRAASAVRSPTSARSPTPSPTRR